MASKSRVSDIKQGASAAAKSAVAKSAAAKSAAAKSGSVKRDQSTKNNRSISGKSKKASTDTGSKKSGSKSYSGDNSGKNVATGGIQLDAVKAEHEKTLKEERTQRCWLCAVIAVCILIACILMGVILADKYGTRKSGPTFSLDFDGKPSSDAAHNGQTPDHAANVHIPKDGPLPNLTEICMKIAAPHGCFYHKKYYPDDCSKTKCNSIIIDLLEDELPLNWKYTGEKKTIDVPDRTPCADGKLCIKKKCVAHPDATSFQKPEPTTGGIRLNCDKKRPSCLKIRGKNIDEKRYTECYKCKDTPWKKEVFKDAIAVRFLSCSNPMPVNEDPKCFMTTHNASRVKADEYRNVQGEYVPFVMYEFCETCTTTKDQVQMACAYDEKIRMFPYAVPCISGGVDQKYLPLFCASDGLCVPLYSKAPETYVMRPIQKC